METSTLTAGLLDFLDKGITSYQASENMTRILDENGFTRLDPSEPWDIERSDKKYIVQNDSAIIAFVVGDDIGDRPSFRLIGSHTDSPTFKIKSNPAMASVGTVRLNTEVYGGAILYSWMDRPLSIGGRIALRSANPLRPEIRLVNIDKDLSIIPSLAIHMNRNVNSGYEFNPQKDTLPLVGLGSGEDLDEDYLENILGQALDIDKEDILDYDLYLYDRQKSCLVGKDEDLISAGRQDNLSMAYSSLMALISSHPTDQIKVLVVTDNEEVGSTSIQGADSPFVSDTLERISLGLGMTREDYLRSLDGSFMVSADMAHAVHPGHLDKADPTNRPILGHGPTIKYAANKSYTSDAYSASVIIHLCEKNNIKYQKFHNRSDRPGGSTIGPITASHLNIRSVDLGGPLLAMHSIRELGSVEDLKETYRLFKALYES